jgi:DedD protein
MMPVSEDTEITLGTGKMLAIFFGLVALCAVFFGMGFSLGKSSTRTANGGESPAVPTTAGVRPAASKQTGSTPDLSFYKNVAQKNADPAPAEKSAEPAADDNKPEGSSDPASPPAVNGYYVQVAAVTKQEDAQALVEALKKKQYPAFSTGAINDKLFHVQVGPFSDIKEAEVTRAKLVGDGYNPILKK